MENKISDLMFLTSSEESKKNYSELINRTVKAIVDSFVDEKAFAVFEEIIPIDGIRKNRKF